MRSDGDMSEGHWREAVHHKDEDSSRSQPRVKGKGPLVQN